MQGMDEIRAKFGAIAMLAESAGAAIVAGKREVVLRKLEEIKRVAASMGGATK